MSSTPDTDAKWDLPAFVKWLGLVFMLAVGFAVIWICWVWYRTELGQTAYMQVRRGDSQARVIQLCGQPAKIGYGPEANSFWEDGKHNVYQTNGACVQYFHYFPPFSISSESWEIGFDARSNVVSKYHFSSP